MTNFQKGSIVPVLVAIIAILIVGGGIYVYQSKNAQVPAGEAPLATASPSTSSSASPAPTPVVSAPVVSAPATNPPAPAKSVPPVSEPARPHAAITVVYPNGNERLNNGGRANITTIKWTSSNMGSSDVQIIATNKATNQVKTIALAAPNTGSFEWKADPSFADGEYKLTISSVQKGLNASDESDGTFVVWTRAVSPQEVFVILASPNGGESYKVGDKMLIKWSSLGQKATSAIISLRTNNRCPYGYACTPMSNSFANIAEISGLDVDKGQYEWTVSKTAVVNSTDKYIITVVLKSDYSGSLAADDSDSAFTISY